MTNKKTEDVKEDVKKEDVDVLESQEAEATETETETEESSETKPSGKKHTMLNNVKYNGKSYMKGEKYALDKKTLKLFKDSGFVK